MPFGRLERTPASQPMSDINMTPLIDVMLVLLVIFMVTAPLMASRLRMDLPRTAGTTAGDDAEAVTLAITADGAWHLDDATVTPEALARALKARAARQPDVDVLVRADRKVPYGDVARLLGLVRAAGLHRLAFVTEAEPGPDASSAHAPSASPPHP